MKFKDLEIGDLVKLNDVWWVVYDYVWSFEVLGFKCFCATARKTIYEEDFEKVQVVKAMHEMEEMPNFIAKLDALLGEDISAEELKLKIRALLYESK